MKTLLSYVRQYHVYVNGKRITDKPMDLETIRNRWGGIRKLEQSGHTLWPVKSVIK